MIGRKIKNAVPIVNGGRFFVKLRCRISLITIIMLVLVIGLPDSLLYTATSVRPATVEDEIEKEVKSLVIGKSKIQVLQILGRPDEVRGEDMWRYINHDAFRRAGFSPIILLRFKDGICASVNIF